MHPYHHALSSAKKHGGEWTHYIEIHEWFDATKQYFGDARHRALRHHTAGIFWCEEEFGITIPVNGKDIPVRVIAEQHVMEDMGFLPSPDWWLNQMMLVPAMNRVPTKPFEVEDLTRKISVEMYKGDG